ncbi:hypothetical protein BJ322DRAFT_1206734 [Thelephora terrestris]|uniref:Uncharacterized protein n=1 Tax=Thelephora terrestris TaxID=56493 RepID=A0A9P6HPB0_9AGAM|nr:hypothetical protein BJ322DRAFT_1206734 [Thelephora terrestris]
MVLDKTRWTYRYTIHTDAAQLESHLQSSPPLILLLDGVDSALDPLSPEAEEICARLEEFGSYKHICLVTTSRIYPDIHGFHRVEIPTPPEDGAQDIFYSLCSLGRSPGLDTLVAKLDFHPFSIELFARTIRENTWDEQELLKMWDDPKGVLRTTYYEVLKSTIEPVFRSPKIEELGTTARDLLQAIASFRSGIEEHQLEGMFRGTGGIREVVDVLCRFSLVYRRNGVLKMLSPLRYYFLESMLVYAETEEVIRWGPECMAAQGVPPVYTQGPPDGWLLDPSPLRPTIRRSRRGWIRRLPQIIKRKLLALFGRRIAPTILIEIEEDQAGDILPVSVEGNPTNTSFSVAQEHPANMFPAAIQGDPANMSLTVPEQEISSVPIAYDMD